MIQMPDSGRVGVVHLQALFRPREFLLPYMRLSSQCLASSLQNHSSIVQRRLETDHGARERGC